MVFVTVLQPRVIGHDDAISGSAFSRSRRRVKSCSSTRMLSDGVQTLSAHGFCWPPAIRITRDSHEESIPVAAGSRLSNMPVLRCRYAVDSTDAHRESRMT